ncbi:DUF4157 domain-containing protein [Leptolyngbya sp. AN02str]|uniref:eCIS core domain-containing protein n=1 Tax=Leptolyngbya sp. AN02str TaxID=3423363 RepID=UPI003D31D557
MGSMLQQRHSASTKDVDQSAKRTYAPRQASGPEVAQHSLHTHDSLSSAPLAKPSFLGLSHELTAAPQAPLVVQPKLMIGAPGDRYEQEADRIAAQVVQQMHSSKPMETSATQKKQVLQPKLAVHSASSNGRKEVPSEIASGIAEAHRGGHPLDKQILLPMEKALGKDLSHVRVHSSGQADTLNRQLGSRAFTRGQDIFFRQGEYKPSNRSNQHLIAHELVHTIQQESAQQPSSSIYGALHNPSTHIAYESNSETPQIQTMKGFFSSYKGLAAENPFEAELESHLDELNELLSRERGIGTILKKANDYTKAMKTDSSRITDHIYAIVQNCVEAGMGLGGDTLLPGLGTGIFATKTALEGVSEIYQDTIDEEGKFVVTEGAKSLVKKGFEEGISQLADQASRVHYTLALTLGNIKELSLLGYEVYSLYTSTGRDKLAEKQSKVIKAVRTFTNKFYVYLKGILDVLSESKKTLSALSFNREIKPSLQKKAEKMIEKIQSFEVEINKAIEELRTLEVNLDDWLEDEANVINAGLLEDFHEDGGSGLSSASVLAGARAIPRAIFATIKPKMTANVETAAGIYRGS